MKSFYVIILYGADKCQGKDLHCIKIHIGYKEVTNVGQ